MVASADLIVRVITDVSKANGLDQAGEKTSKFSSTVAAASKVAAGALIGVGVAAVAAGKAAAEDAASQVQLATAMRNSAGATNEQVAATEAFITKTALATGVADDQLRPALGSLVRATGDVALSQSALNTALDVSAATGKDVTSVSEALAKGYAGNTGALARLVPGIDKAVLASGDMEKVMAELARTTGGAAAAAANTASGRMARMTVAMDEAKESVGTALLPYMAKFATVLGKVAVFTQKNARTVQILAAVVVGLSVAVLAVNAGLKIYNAAMVVTAVVSKAATAASLGTRAALLAMAVAAKATAAAQWLLNAALTANPIGIVIALVVALVAALILAYKRSSTFRAIVQAAMAGAVKAAKAVGRAFVWIGQQAAKVFGWIKSHWRLIAAILFGPVGIAVGLITKHWSKIRAGITVLLSWVKTVWRTAFQVVVTIVRTYISTVKTIIDGVRDAVRAVIEFLRGAWATAWAAAMSAAVKAISAIKAPVDALLSLIERVISAIKRIDFPSPPGWLSKIPGVGSFAAPTPASYRVTTVPTARAGVGVPLAAGATPVGGVHITINGALDPEAVARQINRILSGHTRRVGLVST